MIATITTGARSVFGKILRVLCITVIFYTVAYWMVANPIALTFRELGWIMYSVLCTLLILPICQPYIEHVIAVGFRKALASVAFGLPPLLAFISTAVLFIGDDFNYPTINFWVCLGLWNLLYQLNPPRFFLQVYQSQKRIKFLDEAIVRIGAFWTISCSFIFLGQNVFHFAEEPIAQVQALHKILDIRILVASVLGVFILTKALIDAGINHVAQPASAINGFKVFRAIHKAGKNKYAAWSIAVVAKFFIDIINSIASPVKAFLHYCLDALIDIARSLGNYMVNLVNVFIQAATIASIVTVMYLVYRMTPGLIHYLNTFDYGTGIWELQPLVFMGLAIWILLMGYNRLTTTEFRFDLRKFKKDLKRQKEFVSRFHRQFRYLFASVALTSFALFLFHSVTGMHAYDRLGLALIIYAMGAVVAIVGLGILFFFKKPKSLKDIKVDISSVFNLTKPSPTTTSAKPQPFEPRTGGKREELIGKKQRQNFESQVTDESVDR